MALDYKWTLIERFNRLTKKGVWYQDEGYISESVRIHLKNQYRMDPINILTFDSKDEYRLKLRNLKESGYKILKTTFKR